MKLITVTCLLLMLTTSAHAQHCVEPKQQASDRFTAQLDGTVVDNETGLMWMRCILGQNWDGNSCQQPKPWFTYHTWDRAMQSAMSSRFAGYQDWHLPTLEELRTIVEPRCKDPAVDPEIFPGSMSGEHWTMDSMERNDNYAKVINFQNGEEITDLKDNATYVVRLVRGHYQAPKLARNKDDKPAPAVAMSSQALKKQRELQRNLWQDDIHDSNGPGMATLKNPAEATAAYSHNSLGRVDWMKALRTGEINPLASLDSDEPMQVIDLDIIMKDTGDMDYVRFPHNSHTQWLACSNCHPNPFPYRVDLVEFNMNDVLKGKYCGICHGKVSFSPLLCERCHNEKKPGTATRVKQ